MQTFSQNHDNTADNKETNTHERMFECLSSIHKHVTLLQVSVFFF